MIAAITTWQCWLILIAFVVAWEYYKSRNGPLETSLPVPSNYVEERGQWSAVAEALGYDPPIAGWYDPESKAVWLAVGVSDTITQGVRLRKYRGRLIDTGDIVFDWSDLEKNSGIVRVF